MKHLTDSQRQWAWFVALWVIGLAATFVLAGVFRWVVRL